MLPFPAASDHRNFIRTVNLCQIRPSWPDTGPFGPTRFTSGQRVPRSRYTIEVDVPLATPLLSSGCDKNMSKPSTATNVVVQSRTVTDMRAESRTVTNMRAEPTMGGWFNATDPRAVTDMQPCHSCGKYARLVASGCRSRQVTTLCQPEMMLSNDKAETSAKPKSATVVVSKETTSTSPCVSTEGSTGLACGVLVLMRMISPV